jgi:hypothetical protein
VNGRPICPECRNGKHINCDGMAYDDEADDLVLCACPDTDDIKH